MFKTKIRLISEDWVDLKVYKSRFKPNLDEYIYMQEEASYYSVVKVIHSLRDVFELIVVVKRVENINI
jgi:hypothetical protein